MTKICRGLASSSIRPRPTGAPLTPSLRSWKTTRPRTTGASSQRGRSCASIATTPTGCVSSTSYSARRRAREEVLHPGSETKRFADADDLESAWSEHTLLPLPNDPVRYGFAVDSTIGELAPQLGLDEELYRGLRPEALALLLHVADRVRAFSRAGRPLEVTSTVRDDAYQALLRGRNAEATAGYSLHTTGYAFDIRRSYESRAQARAFQFMLDDLTARGLIAWVREPAAIHVTVSSDAEVLVPAFLEPQG